MNNILYFKILYLSYLFFSRSSSAVSSSSRLPSGLGRVRSLTDDPKLLGTAATPPLLSNNNASDNDETTSDTKDPLRDPTQTATPSSVVSLPPVRKTRSNPINITPEKVTKPTGPSRQQQTLLNIQKDVEWLAKQQSRQRSNAAQSKALTGSQGKEISISNKYLMNMGSGSHWITKKIVPGLAK